MLLIAHRKSEALNSLAAVDFVTDSSVIVAAPSSDLFILLHTLTI